MRKYSVLILLSIYTFFLHSQDIEGWGIDSIDASASHQHEWKIDSVSLEKNTSYWNIEASRLYDNNNFISQQKTVLPNQTEMVISGTGLLSDGDYAPFWITNNQHGLGSAERNKGTLRISSYTYQNIGSNFNISGNLDFLAANNLSSDIFIQQLYLDFGYKGDFLVLSIGAKERKSLLKNVELSSGGLTLSNNARPIPQVEFCMPQFIDLPFTQNKLSVMGGISYGWYPDDKFKRNNAADGYYAEKVLYHRKYGFLKFTPNSSWSFTTGLEMDTQWGGHFYKQGEYWDKGSAKLKDFFKVLIPRSGDSSSNWTDQQNIVGNIYGSMHFIAKWNKEKIATTIYHEHFFEDHSGLIFKNMPDGLYGIEINLKKVDWLSHIVLEYLHSKNQSGPFLWDESENIPIQVSGGDNYYNHVDYISTTYHGFTTGNALFTSPIYNNKQSLTIYNTRLSAFHLGIGGNLNPNLRYRTLLSYSRSWGTSLIPSADIRDQLSGLVEVTYRNSAKIRNWMVSAALGYDKSDMVGDNWGGQLKLSKTFAIR